MWCALTLGLLSALAPAPTAGPPSQRPAYLPAPSRPEPPPSQYRLERETNGWGFRDAGFVAHIAEDGSVRFEDRHGEIHLAFPLPQPLPPGTPSLEGTVRGLMNPHARTPPAPAAAPIGPPPRTSPYPVDPLEWCRYPNPCYFQAAVTLVNAVGTFDLTDEIMRLRHKDPYRQQKASFLASTAAFRQDLQRRATARAQRQALEELRRRLDAIDRDPHLAPADRRRAYQALREELDPDPSVSAPARALIDERVHQTTPGKR